MSEEAIEELSEEIWSLAEAGERGVERITTGSKVTNPADVLSRLVDRGLARVEGDRVALTPTGERLAGTIVRRHRLAEVLLRRVLRIDEAVTERTACAVEHVLPESVTDSLCAYLGHPARCPHGKPIPKGACCDARAEREVERVARLPDMPIGSSARIVFITSLAPKRLSALAALGLAPGQEVRLVQRHPSVVLEAGRTTVAIDPEIATEIVVSLA